MTIGEASRRSGFTIEGHCDSTSAAVPSAISSGPRTARAPLRREPSLLQLPEAERTDRIARGGWNWRESGILAAAFLFNLGQGVLRPSVPLYLQDVFAANYRMVTLIPVVFGAGKWAANLPTGYLLDRLGRRRLMIGGLLLIAACDVASAAIINYGTFLFARACAGVGWAMFATVATTAMVNRA